MGSGEQEKGFQVRDRRRFTETGEPKEGESADAAEASREEPRGERERPPSPQPPRREAEGPVEITMTTFLMSLSTQALVLLGDFPDPVTGKSEADLDGAQEIIALIGMLEEKTRGNLDPAETALIDKILFDLRMRYVEKVRK